MNTTLVDSTVSSAAEQRLKSFNPRGSPSGENGVSADSTIETYVAARLIIDNWRWAGVPFLIRAGKSLPVTLTEVRVRLKRPPVALFGRLDATPNEFCFRLNPDVLISLTALAKRPGEETGGDQVQLIERYHPSHEMAPYERLLGGALRGDRTLFGNEEGVEVAWLIVDPIVGDGTGPVLYAQHSWGPTEADRLARDVGGSSPPAPPTEP